MIVGNKLRQARQNQNLSLTAVASKAKISAATLSRIENSKQGVDLGLFLILAKILKATAHDLLEDGNDGDRSDPLASQIASLQAADRAKLWRDLAAQRRTQRTARKAAHNLGQQVEELVAQIEFLREEIENVRAGVRKKK